MAPDSIRTSSLTPTRARSSPRTPPRSKHDMVGTIGQASWLSSVINLINTILGAGTLAMPQAMSHMGIFLGTLVILWSGLTSAFGLYLQGLCAAYLERGQASFFALSQMTYPNAAVVFDAAIAIKCFGVGISYLIIIGDLMPGVVQGFVGGGDNGSQEVVSFLVDRHFWITAFMLVVIPLSFLRRLDSLKYTSVIALISIGYLIVLVVYHFAKRDTIDHYTSPIRVWSWAGIVPALSSLPVVVFAFTCHQNMFSILNEIKDNSHFRTTAVIGASIGGAAAVYVLVAITGYLSFGNDVTGNIVKQYATSVSATIGRLAIVILVMFSYPLQVHPCRASVDAVLKWRPNRHVFKKRFGQSSDNNTTTSNTHVTSSSSTTAADASPPRNTPLLNPSALNSIRPRISDMSDTRFAVITTVVIILSYIVAMSVTSLSKVLAYVGATGSTSISFILPGLFYYKISSPDSPAHQKLLKEQDDWDVDEDDDDEGSPILSASGSGRRNQSLSNESGRPQIASESHDQNGTEEDHERRGLLSSLSLGGSSGNGGIKETWTKIKSMSIFQGKGKKRSKWGRRTALRRLSLALAIYGLVVMITCLIVESVFVAGGGH